MGNGLWNPGGCRGRAEQSRGSTEEVEAFRCVEEGAEKEPAPEGKTGGGHLSAAGREQT